MLPGLRDRPGHAARSYMGVEGHARLIGCAAELVEVCHGCYHKQPGRSFIVHDEPRPQLAVLGRPGKSGDSKLIDRLCMEE
ncbi:hypothetical protein Dimus_013400, partial [Dionaea muscipula]